MRIFGAVALGQADLAHELGHARGHLGGGADFVHAERLGEGGGDGEARIERGVAVLEHHLHLAPVGAIDAMAALPAHDRDAARPVRRQAGNGAQNGGLARSAFTDQREALAFGNAQIDAVDDLGVAIGNVEIGEVDGVHVPAHCVRSSTGSSSRVSLITGMAARRPRV